MTAGQAKDTIMSMNKSKQNNLVFWVTYSSQSTHNHGRQSTYIQTRATKQHQTITQASYTYFWGNSSCHFQVKSNSNSLSTSITSDLGEKMDQNGAKRRGRDLPPKYSAATADLFHANGYCSLVLNPLGASLISSERGLDDACDSKGPSSNSM